MGTQRRLQAGPSDPGAAAAVAEQMTPAVRPAPARQIGAERDEAGAGGDHRTGPGTEGARIRGDRVGGQRQPPHTQFPGEGARQLRAQAVPQAGHPGRADDGRFQPSDPGLRTQRARRRHQLLQEVPRVDAKGPGPHRLLRRGPGQRTAPGGPDDDPQPGAPGVHGEETVRPGQQQAPLLPGAGRVTRPPIVKISTERKSSAPGYQ